MHLIKKPTQSDQPLDKSAGAPRLVKKLHLAGRLITIYGFLWLLVFGYQYAIVDEKPYAQMGLVTFAVILILCGGWLSGIYSRWYAAKTEGELFAALRVTYAGALPTGLIAFVMQCVLVSCLVVWDWDMTLKVRATDEVKEELKWLLGDAYPETQEANIDPETLIWEINSERTSHPGQHRFLNAHSSTSTNAQKRFFDRQLNSQKFEIQSHRLQKPRTVLELRWEDAMFVSNRITDDTRTFYLCNLIVPHNDALEDPEDYLVLLNGQQLETLVSDKGFVGKPRELPPMLQLLKNNLIIRTNFSGHRWTRYCASNYGEKGAESEPEPITELSMFDLNQSSFQLHFLFLGHTSENVLKFKTKKHRAFASYPRFIENLNKVVAFDILKAQIREINPSPLY